MFFSIIEPEGLAYFSFCCQAITTRLSNMHVASYFNRELVHGVFCHMMNVTHWPRHSHKATSATKVTHSCTDQVKHGNMIAVVALFLPVNATVSATVNCNGQCNGQLQQSMFDSCCNQQPMQQFITTVNCNGQLGWDSGHFGHCVRNFFRTFEGMIITEIVGGPRK